MRADDMTVGEAYALNGPRRIKVTLLPTPPDVRAQRKVRLRFETGVTAGRVSDLPSRRIAAPWTGTAPAKPNSPRPRETVLTLTRRPRAGDTVVLPEKGDLDWTVDDVDEDDQARLSTEIYGRPQTRSVPVDEAEVRVRLRAHSEAVSAQSGAERREVGVGREVAGDGEAAAERLRPVTPRRELDELMDDVLFTEACLKDYDRRLGSNDRGSSSDRLREEVRHSGFILREDLGPREYARIRVLGRFDIVLADPPTAGEPVTITGLHVPKSARRRTQAKRSRRSAT
jgi:hypothetical protein